jgi:stage III sporulation protein AB
MRIFGSIFVALSAALFGRYWVSRLRAREDELGALVVLISRLKTELEYSAPPLESLLEALCLPGDRASPRFIADCRDRLAMGTVFPEAWREAVGHTTPRLKEADRAKLLAFGRGLGTTDIPGQSRACSLYADMFAREQASAARECEKYSAYLPKLSLLLGLCGAVLLL